MRKQEGVVKFGYGRIFALIDCVVQSNIISVITMSTLYVFLTTCTQSYGDGTWLVVNDGNGLILAHRSKLQANSFRRKLSSVPIFSISRIVPLSWAFSMHSIRYLCLVSLVSGLSYLSAPYPLSLIMVRQGKRRRSEGHRDSGLHSTVGHCVEPQ